MWKSLAFAGLLSVSSAGSAFAQIIERPLGSLPGQAGSAEAARQLSQNGSAVIVVPVVTLLALMFLAERN